MRVVTTVTDSLKLVVQPYDLETGHCLSRLGFQSIPLVPQLLYLATTHAQLPEIFLQLTQALSEVSQSQSRYCLTRSPIDSTRLLVEFLSAQPLSTITASVKHAWFLQVLAKRRLFFKYQPIFDLQAGHVIAYECLARARSDQGHHFSGQELIEAAISMNLTREFDELARMTCLQSIADIDSQRTFFINILPNALVLDPYSLEQNLQQILELGLRPQQIVFELTEIEVLVQCPELPKVINQLRKWGFGLAVDDFCSSVSTDHYFLDFRPDIIKIDRRIVMGCSQHPLKQILIKSLLNSAHELGVLVLAEGLEDRRDIDFCRELGIDYGQGFGLALPERTLQSTSLNLLELSNAS